MEEIKDNVQIKEDNLDNNNQIVNEDIEKQSYSKYMYKKLQKARKKGKQYGVDVPKLNYSLDKPEKPRKLFQIIGYSMLALTILIAVGFIVAYIVSGIFPMFAELISGTVSVYSKETLGKSLGLSGVASLAVTWIYVLIIILLLIPIAVVWLLVKFTIKNLSFINLSKQEMAKGFEVKRYLLGLYIMMGVSLALVILFAFEGLLNGGLGIFIIVLSIVMFATCLVISIFITKERKKEQVWFNNLEIEKQQDFINQNNSIKKIKDLSSRTTGGSILGRY